MPAFVIQFSPKGDKNKNVTVAADATVLQLKQQLRTDKRTITSVFALTPVVTRLLPNRIRLSILDAGAYHIALPLSCPVLSLDAAGKPTPLNDSKTVASYNIPANG